MTSHTDDATEALGPGIDEDYDPFELPDVPDEKYMTDGGDDSGGGTGDTEQGTDENGVLFDEMNASTSAYLLTFYSLVATGIIAWGLLLATPEQLATFPTLRKFIGFGAVAFIVAPLLRVFGADMLNQIRG